jgi:hypothetical protein
MSIKLFYLSIVLSNRIDLHEHSIQIMNNEIVCSKQVEFSMIYENNIDDRTYYQGYQGKIHPNLYLQETQSLACAMRILFRLLDRQLPNDTNDVHQRRLLTLVLLMILLLNIARYQSFVSFNMYSIVHKTFTNRTHLDELTRHVRCHTNEFREISITFDRIPVRYWLAFDLFTIVS